MSAHDSRCERVTVDDLGNGFMLCHCARRVRIARGLTAPPRDDLEWLPPECPTCGHLVDFDGDLLWCATCHLSWDSRGSGESARFNDEYASTDASLLEQARQWHRNWKARAAS